jgi:hypothetical protein
MALYSLFIEAGGKTTATQIEAESVRSAFATFIDQRYDAGVRRILGNGAPAGLSAADICLFTAMDGLTNMWLGQAGREGKYISVMFALTVAVEEGAAQ